MKHWIIAGLIILLGGFITYYFFLSSERTITEASSIPKLIDLGLISMEKDTTITYSIINKGSHNLKLQDVIPGCYCTIVNSWTRGQIMPGDTATVTLGFKPNAPGYFQETATVKANTRDGVIILVFRGKAEE